MTDDLHHLAAAYALDALDDAERREFEAHYPTCSICSADVQDYRETASHLAVATATEPPSEVKARVMAEISATRQIPPILPERVVDLTEHKRRKPNRMQLTVLAAAAFVAIVGFVAGLQFAGSDDDIDEVLIAADARTLELDGAAGDARVVWSPAQDRAVLIASGLANAGEGMAYELWLIDADGPRPTGLFNPDGDGFVRVGLPLGGHRPAAWGITIEPDSGSDQPTGEILLIGEII